MAAMAAMATTTEKALARPHAVAAFFAGAIVGAIAAIAVVGSDDRRGGGSARPVASCPRSPAAAAPPLHRRRRSPRGFAACSLGRARPRRSTGVAMYIICCNMYMIFVYVLLVTKLVTKLVMLHGARVGALAVVEML